MKRATPVEVEVPPAVPPEFIPFLLELAKLLVEDYLRDEQRPAGPRRPGG